MANEVLGEITNGNLGQRVAHTDGTVPPVSTGTIEVLARVDELDRVLAFVGEELSRRTCPASVHGKVDICLEELFVNVASYAYGAETGGMARVTYTYLADPPGIRIEIADKGEPFDPLAKPDPDQPHTIQETKIGGLGIFMTKKLSDSISYEYKDGQNVTTFELHW